MAELIRMPKLGFDMKEGTLIEWTKQEGDAVAEDEVIAIIETDKASVEVPSFKAGVLRKLLVPAGSIVPIGDPIAVLGSADEPIDLVKLGVKAPAPAAPPSAAAPSVEPAAPAVAAAAPAPAAPAPAGAPAPASPVARRMADELGIDLRQVRGSGPGGRIIKRDIEEALKAREAATIPAVTPPIPIPAYEPVMQGHTVELLTGMRQTIARRMVESKTQAPHFYITMDVDMGAAMALREQLNALLSEGEKISVNDLIIKASALALKRYPRLNGSFADHEIHLHEEINIGVAVAREAGLVTAVVRNADQKSLAQIAREAREVITRAREGRMRAEDMVGSTFTISNLGMFGVDEFIAIINPPQAAILAVGAVQRVPVVDAQGQLAVGTRMKITLSADHRVTDGAEAARFLQELRGALEQPMRLLL